jgi:hypothetical protein
VLTGAYFLPLSFTQSIVIALGVVWVVICVRNLLAQRSSAVAGSIPVGPMALVLSALSSAVALAIVGVAVHSAFIVVFARDLAAPSEDFKRRLVIFFVVLLAVLLAVAAALDRLARRLNARRAEQALRHDGRPEIILLRSFGDDTLTIRSRLAGRSIVERLALRRRDTFEQLIAWTAWRYGPVVAIGEPGTHLPPLGATRAYYPHNQWQEEVARRIQDGSGVVLIAGRTPSLAWELGRMATLGVLSKLLIVFPPLPQPELRRRVAVVYGALGLNSSRVPAARSDIGDLVSLGFDKEGKPFFTVTDGRDDNAYLASLERQLDRIREQGPVETFQVNPAFKGTESDLWKRNLLPLTARSGTVRRCWGRRGRRWSVAAGVVIILLPTFLRLTSPAVIPLPGETVAQTLGGFAVTESGAVLSTLPARHNATLVRDGQTSGAIPMPGAVVVSATSGETVYLGVVRSNALMAVDTASGEPVERWSVPLAAFPRSIAVDHGFVAVTQPTLDEVLIVDQTSGRVVTSIATGPTPIGVAMHDSRLLVTTAGDGAWTEFDDSNWAVVRKGTLPAGASSLDLRGDDLYFISLATGNLVHYSLNRSEIVATTWVNSMGYAAFGEHSALVATSGPVESVVLVDLDTMSISAATPTPDTPYMPIWADGEYYFSFLHEHPVVRVAGE